jgi:uncharacterized RDD family membrane protein YckC
MTCPHCGTPLPTDAPEGLCAACLLSVGDETAASVSFDDLQTVTTGGEGRGRAAPDAQRLTTGQTWGSYRIGALLGRGGMGEVYEAEHLASGRRVALKVLRGRLRSSEDRARFLREGQLAASISHPHTVYIFGSEEIGGMPVISMELLPGGTLKDRVAALGPRPVVEAVAAVLDIIGGLDAAQAAGVLHRDIKPSNCFVEHDGAVKVGDFGLSISTLARDVENDLPSSGFEGTPQFAPPEQLRGEPLDLRADIYAVGATLYYLLTGRPPFDAADLRQLVSRVTTEPAPSPRSLRPEVPARLAAIVQRCLAKTPAERPASYAELAEALRPFALREHVPAGPLVRLVAGACDSLLLALPAAALSTSVWSGPLGSRPALFWALGVLPQFLYYCCTEAIWSASAGKALFGLRVLRADGSTASPARVALRTLLFLSPSTILSLLMFARVLDVQSMTDTVPAALANVLLALLFSSMRRRNGWAALHDLGSDTRVVARVATAEARRRAGVDELPDRLRAPIAGATRCGPFVLLEEAGRVGHDAVAAAFDPLLRRRVWIHFVSEDAPPMIAARRDVSRPTRLRWLTGQRSGHRHWDAFEAPGGEPLTARLSSPVEWGTVKHWLFDLATELVAASRDGSLPALRLDRLWVRDDGRLVLTDFPGHGVAPAADEAADLAPVALVATVASRSARWLTDPAALPLTARRFFDALTSPHPPALDDVRDRLAEIVRVPGEVQRWRRSVPLGLSAGPVLVLTVSGLLVVPSLARLADPDTAMMLNWLEDLRRPAADARGLSDPAQRDALERYLAGRYRTALESEAFWDGALMRNFMPLRATAAEILARHPVVQADELARLSTVLAPRIQSADAHYRRQRAELRQAATIMILALVAIALAFTLVCTIVSSLAVRGGIAARVLGLAVVDGRGREVGRARSLARVLVAWLPALAWLVMLAASPKVQGWVPAPAAPLSTASLAFGVTLAGAAWMIVDRVRGPHDRIAGTWVVPR